MTDREAIEYWVEFDGEIDVLYKLTGKNGKAELDRQRPAVRAAISALQEREERSKGCRLCEDWDYFNQMVCYVPNNETGLSYDPEINFCPKCGRPLNGAEQ